MGSPSLAGFNLEDALRLLGKEKVVTYEQSYAAFKRPLPKGNVVVCPNMGQIRKCAEQNKAGEHQWMLGYASALSFVSQRSILGVNRDCQPCYLRAIGWFLEPEEQAWAESIPEAGYYLLDMMPRWDKTGWKEQEVNIAGLGRDFVRADERVFSQIILANLKVTGQRLFQNVFHWGRILNTKGCRVSVGLDPGGLIVTQDSPQLCKREGLFVCVARQSRELVTVA